MSKNDKNLSSGVFRYIAVVLIAVLAVLVVFLVTMEEPKDPQPSADESSSESESSTDIGNSFPEVPAIDMLRINELIETYYQAKMDADADTLNKIVVTDQPFKTADLLQDTNIISRYDNFRMYVIPGNVMDFDIVYVTYDIYFQGLSVGAPALNHFVIQKQNADTFRIYDKTVSESFEKWLRDTESADLIVNLKKQVEEDLQVACLTNQDLAELIDFLNHGGGEEDTGTEQELSTDPESESPDAASENSGEDASTDSETADEHN